MSLFSRFSPVLVPVFIVAASWLLTLIWQATPWWDPGIDSNYFRRLVCIFSALISFVLFFRWLAKKTEVSLTAVMLIFILTAGFMGVMLK